ncbi:MAG: hypothetical protein Kow0059_08820 [Candidatus Sumerlaeia bacterium]
MSDPAAVGREELEVVELFRAAKDGLTDHMPPATPPQEEMDLAGRVAQEPAASPRRMKMLEVTNHDTDSNIEALPSMERWARLDTALRAAYRLRQRRAARIRTLQPAMVAVVITLGLAVAAFAAVMAWRQGEVLWDALRRLFVPSTAQPVVGMFAGMLKRFF